MGDAGRHRPLDCVVLESLDTCARRRQCQGGPWLGCHLVCVRAAVSSSRAVVRQDPRPVQGRLCDSGSRDLLNAGIVPPAVERMAAHVTLHDGTPRFVWTDSRPDQSTCARVLLDSIAERQRWHDQTAVGQAYRSGLRDLNL